MSMAAGSDRTLDVGKVLQDGLGVLAQNFVPFAIMAVVLEGIPAAANAYIQTQAATHPIAGLLGVPVVLVNLVTGAILQGAVIYGAMRGLEGRPASIGDCLTAGRKRWLSMIALLISLGLSVGLGFLFLIVPGVLLALRWSVAGPALIMEGYRVSDAMHRSAVLTRNRRWSILLLYLIYLAVIVVLGLVTAALDGGFTAVPSRPVVAMVLGPLTNIIYSLLLTTVSAALFRQLRGDQDGAAPDALAEVFA